MATITPRQEQMIKSLFLSREYSENGKTLTVNGQRFRTTSSQIGEISKQTASRLIDALLKAPEKEIAVPHFQRFFDQWVVASAPREWKEGDVVEISLKRGGVKQVVLTSRIDNHRWHFCKIKPEQSNQQAVQPQPSSRTLPSRNLPSQPTAMATKRQIDLIAHYVRLGRHLEGGFMAGCPTTIDEMKKLTRSEADLFIRSLEGDY